MSYKYLKIQFDIKFLNSFFKTNFVIDKNHLVCVSINPSTISVFHYKALH